MRQATLSLFSLLAAFAALAAGGPREEKGLDSPTAAKLEFPARPMAPVVDLAGLLSLGAVARFNGGLEQFSRDGGAQIQVLVVPSLGGLPIEQAAIQVVDRWKLGAKGKDDGLLLLIAKAERRARIEVGRGLEGDLPDAIAKRIVADVIAARFREGAFDDGVRLGLLQIAAFTNPSLDGGAYFGGTGMRSERLRDNSLGSIGLPALILLFLAVSFVFWLNRRGGGSGFGGYGGLGGGFGGGGFSGGGGGWGGGGGGFSGGGASGDW